jgi:2-amino-4-hydroxy-6-hydroxymethyldihydropteridine diphosphokinase
VKQVIVYLGLGSNLEGRKANLRRALELLSTDVKVVKISPTYDTAPVGNTDQPRFLNLVCAAKTLLSPPHLLTFAKNIETKIGRINGPRNSPRPIDIDILFYGDLVLETPALVIPHPRLMERAFVLAPLADIAPDFKHPVSGKTVRQMLKELKRTAGDAVINK